jgi:hypothetical protein
VISRSAYQRVVTRLSRRGSLQNTFGKIGLRRRGAMFKRHPGHNLFQGSTHDLDEFRVELLHGFGTPFCEETQTRLGPSPHQPYDPDWMDVLTRFPTSCAVFPCGAGKSRAHKIAIRAGGVDEQHWKRCTNSLVSGAPLSRVSLVSASRIRLLLPSLA